MTAIRKNIFKCTSQERYRKKSILQKDNRKNEELKQLLSWRATLTYTPLNQQKLNWFVLF